ncbi:VanZ family protein [Sulfurovum sp. zt1-1]|uniref:VanZ family protein n=1 Tax=Sulfurovum zhangzhouensis TaxID=3019067 RepID=A0ABT7QZZ1_9BACT|nr:VanZ family protein [Sulfurovum zhangzhouensis]MDM5272383.1 VanZ family protein [Sulfurovum zhangzhouensis]
MFSLRVWLPLSFFIFISWIIFLADSANYNFAFYVVGGIPYGDKMAHALLYGMMALLLNYGLKFKSFSFKWQRIQLGSILIFLFAAIEEFSQYFIASRTFDLYDLLADFIGIVFFSLIKGER